MNGERFASMFSPTKTTFQALNLNKRTRRIHCWPVEAEVKVQGIESERKKR